MGTEPIQLCDPSGTHNCNTNISIHATESLPQMQMTLTPLCERAFHVAKKIDNAQQLNDAIQSILNFLLHQKEIYCKKSTGHINTNSSPNRRLTRLSRCMLFFITNSRRCPEVNRPILLLTLSAEPYFSKPLIRNISILITALNEVAAR